MKDREYALLECFKENWQHARHVENERLSFTQFFAMVVGVAVTVGFQNAGGDKGPLIIGLSFFVLFLSFLGLLLANRWGSTFDTHMEKATKAAQDLELNSYVYKHDINPNKLRLSRTRYLFCYYYAGVFGVAAGAILYVFVEQIVWSTLVAGLAFALSTYFVVFHNSAPAPKTSPITAPNQINVS